MSITPINTTQARFSVLSRIIGIVTMAAAALVVAGWVFHIEWLKSISPQWVSMKVNTAVCFLLTGLALTLLADKPTTRARRWVARVAAFVVMFMALLTIAEHAVNHDFGVDQLLLVQPVSEGILIPGRMSLAASVNFLLLGLALLLLDWQTRRGYRLAQPLALMSALVGLFAVTGYLFGVKSLYALSPFFTMAAHTAVLFFVLSVGVLFARSSEGPLGLLTSTSIGGAMTRRLFLFTIIVPLLLGWLRVEGEQRGLYGAEFGLALYATINIFVLALFLGLTALWLNRNDARRQEAEMLAEESRLRLAGIIASAMDAIITVDESQKILLFNAAAEKMFRCPAPAALGQPLGQFIPERLRDAHFSHVHAYGQTGESSRAMGKMRDLLGLRATGEEFPLEASISQTAVGDKKFFTAILRDITWRKHDEEVRARLAAIVEFSDDAIIGKTPEGIITSWNHAAERLFGFAAQDIVGEPVTLIIPADRQDEEARILEQLKRGEYIRHYETVRQCRDGRRIDVSLTISPIRDGLGKIVGVSKIARDITERKRVLEALREREEQFSLCIEHNPVALAMFDNHMRYLAVSHRWLADYGITDQTLIGRNHYEVFPEIPVRWREIHQRCLAGAVERSEAEQFVRADGSVNWIRWEVRPWRRPNGKIGGLLIFSEDITERKRAEEGLRLFRTLVDNSIDAFEVIDPATGRILDASKIDCAELGYTREELLKLTVFDLDPTVNPADWPKHMEQIRRSGSLRTPGLHRRKDGRTFPVELSVKWVQLDREYLVAVVRDITERRRAEAALHESNERFREITENINEVFWITDATMADILYVSPAYEKIWGRTCESLYAKPHQWVEVIHPDDRERIMRSVMPERLQVGFDETYRILRPDGAVRWIHDHAVMLRDPAGNIFRIVGVAEDITKEQKLEQQFRQAQKMEAIGTLAGGIAHDFNNILAAMCGYTELAKLKLADNPAVRDYLEAVMHAGQRATALVRQILTFSRQQEQAERKSVNIGAVVEETLKLLRSTIPSTIEFIFTHDPDVAPVLADSSQIHQIMMNLGTNAWHAMRDQPGRLEVNLVNFVVDKNMAEMHPRLRLGPYVRLSISDTGCGMDQATQERIFEPFFTTKPLGEGTGLGLSVVHGIMESSDGLITVYSTPGAGTVFHLYFPAYREAAALAPAADGEAPRGEGRRILYVDDELPLAVLGQKTLEQLGYQVVISTKVAEALEWVRAEPGRFDLVITDQTMPGMTGTDFAAQLLKIRADLPIILTTGYSPYLTVARVQALGMRDLLLKPHTLHTLGHAVHRALQEKKSG